MTVIGATITEQRQWYLTDEEQDMLAQGILPALQQKLALVANGRVAVRNNLDELAAYWTCSVIGRSNRFWNADYSRNDFEALSPEDTLTFLLTQRGTWNRGIELYNRMAGESLPALIDAQIARKGSASLLDIGCGAAHFFREVRDRYGSTVECCGVAERIPLTMPEGMHFTNTLAEILPESWGNRFDIVTCFESSMYFYNVDQAFREAVRVTTPEGILFFGCGALKDIGNDQLLERVLASQRCKPALLPPPRLGKDYYQDIFDRWLEHSEGFWRNIVYAAQDNPQHETTVNEARVRIEEREVTAWCPITLKVTKV